MKPTFVQPCFIRKNTPELRRKLEELGYKHSQYDWPQKSIDKCRILFTDFYDLYLHSYIESKGKNFLNTHLDCGTNEDLFLAVAALREDSDKNQWFCDDIEESKSFFFCEYDDVEKHIHEKMDGWDCEGFHKATIEELIEHFKKD